MSEEAPAARIPILTQWEAAQTPASGAWAQKRRLAAAMRLVIGRLVESNAPENELAERAFLSVSGETVTLPHAANSAFEADAA